MGCCDGANVGGRDGAGIGTRVGDPGADEGAGIGTLDGAAVGISVGEGIGTLVGSRLGELEGASVGVGVEPLQIPDEHTSLLVEASLSSHLVHVLLSGHGVNYAPQSFISSMHATCNTKVHILQMV